MSGLTRRQFLTSTARVGLALLGLDALAGCRPRKSTLDELVVQGAPSPPSLALLRIAAMGAPADLAASVRFQLWSTADEMRARITSHQAHFSGLPVNVAATLYNRGIHVQLLNIYIWGILYLVTSDPGVTSWSDLQGQRLLIPFRGDLPDILTQYLLRKNGLLLGADIEPTYLSAAPEAAQMLAAGRASHAVLSEPSATLAILKAAENGVTLRRAIDYGQAWAEATGRSPRIPMAGVVAGPSLAVSRMDLLTWFQQAHREATAWVTDHAEEAVALGADVIKAIPAAAMQGSLPYIRFSFVEAQEARADVDFFLSELQSLSPELIGGQLPPDAFYYQG